jgi:hypothetical protein
MIEAALAPSPEEHLQLQTIQPHWCEELGMPSTPATFDQGFQKMRKSGVLVHSLILTTQLEAQSTLFPRLFGV